MYVPHIKHSPALQQRLQQTEGWRVTGSPVLDRGLRRLAGFESLQVEADLVVLGQGLKSF